MASENRFERRPWVTGIILAIIGCIIILILCEICLRVFFGLGDPVLYRSSPLFGYRLQPDQLVHRTHGTEIRVNNLSLRADRDWDTSRQNKVLFLGNSVTFGGTYIGTKELFSHLAVDGLDGYVGGNAGVNGWGIENIRALVVDDAFTPASIYVSVLQEMDFYRGLSKLSGKPFWSTKPTFAIQELLHFFYMRQAESMYEGHERFVTPLENEKTVERSVQSLKTLDDYLKSMGFIHLIYMSTNTHQLFEDGANDSLVYRYLDAYHIAVIQIRQNVELTKLSKEEQKKLFYDWNHLTVEGHQLWARIFNRDLRRIVAGKNLRNAN